LKKVFSPRNLIHYFISFLILLLIRYILLTYLSLDINDSSNLFNLYNLLYLWLIHPIKLFVGEVINVLFPTKLPTGPLSPTKLPTESLSPTVLYMTSSGKGKGPVNLTTDTILEYSRVNEYLYYQNNPSKDSIFHCLYGNNIKFNDEKFQEEFKKGLNSIKNEAQILQGKYAKEARNALLEKRNINYTLEQKERDYRNLEAKAEKYINDKREEFSKR
jgi:hypothetical protein